MEVIELTKDQEDIVAKRGNGEMKKIEESFEIKIVSLLDKVSA